MEKTEKYTLTYCLQVEDCGFVHYADMPPIRAKSPEDAVEKAYRQAVKASNAGELPRVRDVYNSGKNRVSVVLEGRGDRR